MILAPLAFRATQRARPRFRALSPPLAGELNAETVKALNDPAVKEKLAKAGGDPLPMKPAEFDAFVKTEIDVNAVLVKAAKIQPN